MSASIKLESLDSSSPLVTKSIAAGLMGEDFKGYEFQPWQRAGLSLLSRMPAWVNKPVISFLSRFSAINPSLARNLEIEKLISERLADYRELEGHFQVITTGAALGGATAQISLAMGAPFLPIAFVMTLRGGSVRGETREYFMRSFDLSKSITQDNPEIMAIQHFDPVHDGWITRWANHLRLKLLSLPEIYKNYIRRNLTPGGSICYLDCGARWLRYRVGERNIFQIGGWGDISPQEFINGSTRLKNYAEKARLTGYPWHLDGYPLEEGPESEWGCEEDYLNSLRDFCQENGYRLIHISLPDPHDFSTLAFKCTQSLLEKANRRPAGVFIEMFSQFDPTITMRSGLLPVWLVFNTHISLDYLRKMKTEFMTDKPVFFSALSTFTITPDIVPWEKWMEELKDFEVVNCGARADYYPTDLQALIAWRRQLEPWISGNENLLSQSLSPQELHEIAAKTRTISH